MPAWQNWEQGRDGGFRSLQRYGRSSWSWPQDRRDTSWHQDQHGAWEDEGAQSDSSTVVRARGTLKYNRWQLRQLNGVKGQWPQEERKKLSNQIRLANNKINTTLPPDERIEKLTTRLATLDSQIARAHEVIESAQERLEEHQGEHQKLTEEVERLKALVLTSVKNSPVTPTTAVPSPQGPDVFAAAMGGDHAAMAHALQMLQQQFSQMQAQPQVQAPPHSSGPLGHAQPQFQAQPQAQARPHVQPQSLNFASPGFGDQRFAETPRLSQVPFLYGSPLSAGFVRHTMSTPPGQVRRRQPSSPLGEEEAEGMDASPTAPDSQIQQMLFQQQEQMHRQAQQQMLYQQQAAHQQMLEQQQREAPQQQLLEGQLRDPQPQEIAQQQALPASPIAPAAVSAADKLTASKSARASEVKTAHLKGQTERKKGPAARPVGSARKRASSAERAPVSDLESDDA